MPPAPDLAPDLAADTTPGDRRAAPADPLVALRAEIDRLDDTLHDLLMDRAAIVTRLAASRVKPTGTILRPGREAAVLRRLLGRHSGPLPATTLVRLWREVFAASLALQDSFSIAVHATVPAHKRLTREHFGSLTPVRSHPTPARALAALAGGEVAAAVLPMPREDDPPEAAWWVGLEATRLAVVARLPFFCEGEPEAEALVLAAGLPDPSGDDHSLLRLEPAGEASQARLAARLADAGFTLRRVLRRRDSDPDRALVEVAGLVRLDDPRLAALAPDRAKPLGAYAVPIRGPIRTGEA